MATRGIAIVVLVALLWSGLPPSAGAATPTPVETRAARLAGLPSAPWAGADGPGRLSEPVAAPLAFSLLGFEVPPGSEVTFRTSADGRRWTPWAEAEVDEDEGPDLAGPESAAARNRRMSLPVWVGRARFLQIRVGGADPGARPERVGVHLIDSAGLWRSAARRAVDALGALWRRPVAAGAAPVQPGIVSRAQWGADESIRRGAPAYARRARLGILHHTAGSNGYGPEDGPAVVRGIYRYHVESNGWNDIGYNLLVDRYGTVYEGRAGGVEAAVVGAHAGGFNTGSFGVAVIGEFGSGAPPPAAVDALARLLAWKYDVHHVDVDATVDYVSAGSDRYPAGTTVRLATMSGHRDTKHTSCPGAALYELLPRLRERVRALQGEVILDHRATPDRVVLQADGSDPPQVQLSARLRPAGAWTLEVTGPDGRLAHRDAGAGAAAASLWRPPADGLRGRYTYTFSSPGRRSASDYVEVFQNVLRRVGDDPDPVNGAVELSREAFPGLFGAGRAVLARTGVFADAMAGGPLAGREGPVLLTSPERLDDRVRAELERVLPPLSVVYVLGGPGALSDTVVAQLSPRWRVRRLAGPGRVETAAAVAREVVARSGSTTALVARAGPDDVAPWADALAGGAYGAARSVPVLLTDSRALSPATAAVLDEVGVADSVGLG
ncbi:MAG TPA: cell wall-binding repeat-containing protein, partial [Egibacteraceae bacterium]|nr:cell wall-binding repeat-containing protein [Egibacteraceae bacterium]